MSTVKANAFLDASGGNTATINAMTPTADSLQGFRNRIINGDMRIDQRNAGASASADTGGQYFLDRWTCSISAGSKFTVQRSSTSATGFSNSMLITSSTAWSIGVSDYATMNQYIEGFNAADLAWGTANAKTITLSFWVRSSVTGTLAGVITNQITSSAATRSYPFTYTISSANTFEQKTVTIAGDTSGTWGSSNAGGIAVDFSLAAGSSTTGTAGAWAGSNYRGATGQTNILATNGATFYITGVQLEVGSVATPFERRDYGRELIMCQRYYWKYTRTTNSVFGVFFPSNWYNGDGDGVLRLPVTMRSTPTASFEAAANYAFHQRGLSSGALSSISLSQGDVDAVQISTASATAGATNYAQIYANASTSVSMAFSSEL